MGIEIEKFFRGNAKNSIYTATSIFGLVILISILFVIIPLLGEIKKNSNDLVVRKASLILLESQASEIGKFKNNPAFANFFFIRLIYQIIISLS